MSAGHRATALDALDGELARRWSERSRQEILGYWPQFALGAAVSDRNTVVAHDLSGLRR
jgi:Icc protein